MSHTSCWFGDKLPHRGTYNPAHYLPTMQCKTTDNCMTLLTCCEYMRCGDGTEMSAAQLTALNHEVRADYTGQYYNKCTVTHILLAMWSSGDNQQSNGTQSLSVKGKHEIDHHHQECGLTHRTHLTSWLTHGC